MIPIGSLCVLLLLCGCGGDDAPTGPEQVTASKLDYDWTHVESDDTWSFDIDGRFWFFGGDPPDDPFNSDNDFQGTWTLDGDRIELTIDGRVALVLQVALENKVLTVTRLCDESADFFDAEGLAACRAAPTRAYHRASLFDLLRSS